MNKQPNRKGRSFESLLADNFPTGHGKHTVSGGYRLIVGHRGKGAAGSFTAGPLWMID